MKLLFSLFFVCALTASNGQVVELQGTYGASFIGGESIDFVGKDSFYLSGFYCTWGVRGKGRCEIRNNKLYLYFEKTEQDTTTIPARAPEIITVEKSDSLSTIRIICLDEKERPIPVMDIRIRGGKTGTTTNEKGIGFLKLAKSGYRRTIETTNSEYETGTFSIAGDSSYTIRMFHRSFPSIRELNNGQVWVYEIEDLTEDMILMKPAGDKGRSLQYRKRYPKE